MIFPQLGLVSPPEWWSSVLPLCLLPGTLSRLCHLHGGRRVHRRERQRRNGWETEAWGERGRICWRDQRWACGVKYRSCGIINGYYESYADKWNILTVQFSQLGVMDGTVKQPESPTLMTDVSLNAHCAINPEICRCGLMLMEELKARVEV